ncbi:MAG: hypothetical protein CVT94_14190 [Bacteroidetes bacterium HGW-Bacteroidetes-11]|jgi:hypothetical protein|nr:MAG: hypothetical protein CVT94_14190 [Bacteroidetes bacterium HGW-Bacteroidetes-11]
MLNKGYLKPVISIEKIGKIRFLTGIVIGILVAFLASYFLNYSRESMRMLTFFADPLILSEKEFRLYDLFFAAFSTSFGFGFTIAYWAGGRNPNIKRRYLMTFVASNAWMVSIVAFALVARYGSNLPIIMYGLYGYDGQFDLLNDYWYIFIMIPAYVFFAHWNTIRLVFRTRFWVIISIGFYLIISFSLYKTTAADRNILNQTYYSRHKQRFDFIDSEFDKASRIGIFFSDTTKEILRKENAERTTDLVYKLKNAFQTDSIIPVDTLILQKIVIHNMNKHGLYLYGHNKDRDLNWPYALPEQIYNQILKNDVNSKETELLFEILAEQIAIFTAPENAREGRKKYTFYEHEKSNFKRNLMSITETIQSRLLQVVRKLRSEKSFEKYHYLIPEFEFDDYNGRQKHFDLKLTE